MYTVMKDGAVESGLSERDVAYFLLTCDGREVEVRGEAGNENRRGDWTMWSRQPIANVGWQPLSLWSSAENRDDALSEILADVFKSAGDQFSDFTIITDEQYLAELREDMECALDEGEISRLKNEIGKLEKLCSR